MIAGHVLYRCGWVGGIKKHAMAPKETESNEEPLTGAKQGAIWLVLDTGLLPLAGVPTGPWNRGMSCDTLTPSLTVATRQARPSQGKERKGGKDKKR